MQSLFSYFNRLSKKKTFVGREFLYNEDQVTAIVGATIRIIVSTENVKLSELWKNKLLNNSEKTESVCIVQLNPNELPYNILILQIGK